MSTEIPDGDLVQLARDGDPVAFRLLVERHQPAARARARSLCGNPSDVDDVVQEAFLRALISLDRLRDPDRFAGWLSSIVTNVCRASRRHAPVTLLPDLPEPLHPLTVLGQPSADDLDRADVLRTAVAALPEGQRRAVTLHYYADLPAGQVAESAGAARASLHKARLKLRAYLIEHRPDFVPATRRTPMTAVRIARAERRIPPGPEPIGFPSSVIMLADDAGRRELPVWALNLDPRRLLQLFETPAAGESGRPVRARTADELSARLLRAAGARVTGVDIDELGPEVAVARIALTGPAGSQHVTASITEALAVAITAGAPVRVADAVMDRLAVPVPEDDGGPLPLPEPAAALAVLRPGRHPRYEPRNLAFADGLDRWQLGGSFTGHASDSHWHDYSCSAADGTAVLASAVPQPAGFAFLGQEIFADDYRGTEVTFRGEFRTREAAAGGASRTGLFLRVVSGRDVRQHLTERAAVDDPDNTIATVPAGRDWTGGLVTARVPDDASTLVFGIFLAGQGQIEMRDPELTSVP
jgi:RNA polymerase sigma-70 factor (ECF subfamily)